MERPFDAMLAAVQEAREVNRVVDSTTNTLVDLIEGRLVHVSPYRLKKHKAQLQRFNGRTGEWKD